MRAALSLLVLAAAGWNSVHAQVLSGAAPPGRMVFTPEEVRITAGCASPRQESLTEDMVIPIAGICDPGTWKKAPVPATACNGRTMAVLGVRFRGSDTIVLAEALTLTERHFHVRLLTSLEDAHGPWTHVEEVSRFRWCTDEGSAKAARVVLPQDSCREARQFAVAFDYGAPLSNRILTNGFSFFVRMAGESRPDLDVPTALNDLRSSFGTALTIWMSALQDNDDLLTPAVRAFVGGKIHKSPGGYSMLLPPQVVRLSCPHAATFIVEFNFGAGDTFLNTPGTLMLARARLEGRTIALNLRDVDCFKTMLHFDSSKRLALKDDRCVNLLPVLTHELGHAFGMDHIPDSTGAALMNPRLSDIGSVPTRLDVAAFVSTLERSITGAAPGDLEFRASEGLLAPTDWTSSSRRAAGRTSSLR